MFIKYIVLIDLFIFQGNSRKTSSSASLTMLKPLTMCITTNCEKSSRDGNARLPYLPPEKPVMQAKE